MSKTKYKYNPETLSYEEVKRSGKEKLFRAFLFVLPAIVLLGIGGFIGATLVKSPSEIKDEREKEFLEAKYAEMEKKMALVDKVLEDIEHRDDNIYRVIFEAEPFPQNVRNMGVGGSDRYAKYSGYETSEIVKKTARKLDELERHLYAQSKSFDEVQELVKRKKEMLSAIPSIQPISNKDLTRIASGFGIRIHPVYKIPKKHDGIDFTAPPGTDIYATGNGKVVEVGWKGGYGKTVVVDHGFGFKTLYAHCSGFNVKVGQEVKKGEVIAYVGNTGVSTGPHLHYEVRRKMPNGGRYYFAPVDPVNYFFNDLTPEEYEKVIKIAAHANQSLS